MSDYLLEEAKKYRERFSIMTEDEREALINKAHSLRWTDYPKIYVKWTGDKIIHWHSTNGSIINMNPGEVLSIPAGDIKFINKWYKEGKGPMLVLTKEMFDSYVKPKLTPSEKKNMLGDEDITAIPDGLPEEAVEAIKASVAIDDDESGSKKKGRKRKARSKKGLFTSRD